MLNPLLVEPQQNGEQSRYGPEAHNPLVLHEDSGRQQAGHYDAYVGMVRSMVDREMRTLGNYVQSGWYAKSPRLRSLVIRYYKLTQWQLKAPAGLLNHRRGDLLKERASLQALLVATEHDLERGDPTVNDKLFTFDHDMLTGDPVLEWITIMPMTVGDAYDRLDGIAAEVYRLTAQINWAKRQGYYFDCGPIIEYFKTPYDERGQIDLMAVAPFYLQRLQIYVDVSIAEIWRHQNQRIIAQQSDINSVIDVAPDGGEAPKRRGIFGRIRG